MNKNLWIVGVCNTDGDGIDIETVIATDEEIKQYLINRVNTDKENDDSSFDYGCETVNDVVATNSSNNEYYAYAVYSNYHIDYTAVRAVSLTPKLL